MGHRLTNEERAAIARKWRGSGQTQAVFATEHGITDRTLRAWLNRWAPSHPASPEVVRELVEQVIERLRGLVVASDPHSGTQVLSDDLNATTAAPTAAAPPPSSAARPVRQGDVLSAVTWDLANIVVR